MPEASHSMLLSDARQTSPLPASALLPHRSVCPPDLDLRQVPRASEGRGQQIESSSNLGSGWHPWRRTGALGRVPGSRLEAPATVCETASMKDFVWRRIPHRRVRPDLVVPALEPRQGSAETAVCHVLSCSSPPAWHVDSAMRSRRCSGRPGRVLPLPRPAILRQELPLWWGSGATREMAALGGSAATARGRPRARRTRRLPLPAHGQGPQATTGHPSLRLHPLAPAHAPARYRRRDLSALPGQDEDHRAGAGPPKHRPLPAPPGSAHGRAVHGPCPRTTVLAEPRPAPPLQRAARRGPSVGDLGTVEATPFAVRRRTGPPLP